MWLSAYSSLEFTIGEGSMIQGWDQGLLDMCVGELRELIAPSNYAYGDLPVGDAIPPKADLMFYVELLDIKDGQPKPDIFGQVDANGDGLISHDEVSQFICLLASLIPQSSFPPARTELKKCLKLTKRN
jgi:hypothetical protein